MLNALTGLSTPDASRASPTAARPSDASQDPLGGAKAIKREARQLQKLANMNSPVNGKRGRFKENSKLGKSLKSAAEEINALLNDGKSREAARKGNEWLQALTPAQEGVSLSVASASDAPVDKKMGAKRNAETEDRVLPEFEAFQQISNRLQSLENEKPWKTLQYLNQVARGDFGMEQAKQLPDIITTVLRNALDEGAFVVGQGLSLAPVDCAGQRIYDALKSNDPFIQVILDDGIPGSGPDRAHLDTNVNYIGFSDQGNVRPLKNRALDELAIEHRGRSISEILSGGRPSGAAMQEARRQFMLSLTDERSFEREFLEDLFRKLKADAL